MDFVYGWFFILVHLTGYEKPYDSDAIAASTACMVLARPVKKRSNHEWKDYQVFLTRTSGRVPACRFLSPEGTIFHADFFGEGYFRFFPLLLTTSDVTRICFFSLDRRQLKHDIHHDRLYNSPQASGSGFSVLTASSAIALMAESSNSSSTSSSSRSALYCLIMEFLGSVYNLFKAVPLQGWRAFTLIGRRPMNSGISPNFYKIIRKEVFRTTETRSFSSLGFDISSENPSGAVIFLFQ